MENENVENGRMKSERERERERTDSATAAAEGDIVEEMTVGHGLLSQTAKEQRNERTNKVTAITLFSITEIKILISHLFIWFYIVFFFSFLVNGPIKFYTMVQHEI
jgi:hypothetical protein